MSASNGKILSWIPSEKRPEFMDIRDDGQEEYAGKLDENGELVLDDDGNAVDPPRSYRPAWPEGYYVTIRAQITSGLQSKAKRMNLLDEEGDDLPPATRFRIWDAPNITCALMIDSLHGRPIPHPDGPDPDTGQERWLSPVFDEENAPTPEDVGKPFPDGFFGDPDNGGHAPVFQGTDIDRLRTSRRVPGVIIDFVDNYIEKKLQDPLGLKALFDGTGERSTPGSTPSSKTSRSSGKSGERAARRS